MILSSEEIEDRFDRSWMPEPNTGCWIWARALNDKGYGRFCYNWTVERAHRVAWKIYRGEIPIGMQIDHLCRNRFCVNPNHLEVVTQQENIRRGEAGVVTKQKQKAKTHCVRGHAYEGSNLYEWERRGWRQCRKCQEINRQKRKVDLRKERAKDSI